MSSGKGFGVPCSGFGVCGWDRGSDSGYGVWGSGLTLSDPMDCSLPGSSIHEIFQARVLEWGAIAFSPCGTRVKNLPVNAGDVSDVVHSLSREDPLEEGIATHFNILSWRIPHT